MAYLLLAALSTPLVLSVHSVVSFDFTTSVVPGWHTTIFPLPYFRGRRHFQAASRWRAHPDDPGPKAIYGLHDLITEKLIDNMARDHPALLAPSSATAAAWSSSWLIQRRDQYELQTFKLRGLYGPSVWYVPTACSSSTSSVPQLFWFK